MRRTTVKLVRLFRFPVGLIAAASTIFAVSGSAQAALLTGSATNCQSGPNSQVFAPWGDPFHYDLVPGGTFESGDASWSLNGSASVVTGNESFFVNSSGDSQSLALPSGSSATSPTFCVGVKNPSVRLFAENTGDPNSSLGVVLNFVGPLGLPLSLQIASVNSGSTWAPTPILPLVVNLLTLLPNNETPVSLTFVPHGASGNWQIDDVYVDPFGRG
jgi:hypothetical protein